MNRHKRFEKAAAEFERWSGLDPKIIRLPLKLLLADLDACAAELEAETEKIRASGREKSPFHLVGGKSS